VNVLWASCNSTSLDPMHAHIIDLSICVQRKQKIGSIKTVKLRPVLLSDDLQSQGLSAESICKVVNGKSGDPRKQLTICEDDGTPLFLYSKETVEKFLHYDPKELVFGESRLDPLEFLNKLRAFLGNDKWVLAGWGIDYLAQLLEDWSSRLLDKEAHSHFMRTILGSPTMDLIQPVRLARMFDPAYGDSFALSAVAQRLGLQVDQSTESKLKAILTIAKKLGGAEYVVPSAEVSSKIA